MKPIPFLIFFFFLLSGFYTELMAKPSFRFEAELGSSWQTRNDVQVPRSSGTKISLSDLEKGPFFFYRLTTWFHLNEKHSFRALYAPFEADVEGISPSDFWYNNVLFSGNLPIQGTYKFNSYRLAYLYTFSSQTSWRFSLGFSAKIRDAKVNIQKGSNQSEYSNLGFVPLLVGRVEYHFSPDFWTLVDVEALAAPQGRAEDVTFQIHYRFKDPFDIGLGYRMVEGGADVEKVYTFAWLHYLLVSIGVEF